MKEYIQANNFYRELTADQKKDLIEAISDSILFLDYQLQVDVISLLRRVNEEIAVEIEKRNNFTM